LKNIIPGLSEIISGPQTGKPCHFPYIYKGVEYNGCTMEDSPGTPWCASNEEYSNTNYGYCNCSFGGTRNISRWNNKLTIWYNGIFPNLYGKSSVQICNLMLSQVGHAQSIITVMRDLIRDLNVDWSHQRFQNIRLPKLKFDVLQMRSVQVFQPTDAENLILISICVRIKLQWHMILKHVCMSSQVPYSTILYVFLQTISI
jgi:hypothetical protein